MSTSFDGKLVVAISSRALFDLEESNRVFEERGVEAYYQYQREHEDERLEPGIAFALVKKLLALNTLPRCGRAWKSSCSHATPQTPVFAS